MVLLPFCLVVLPHALNARAGMQRRKSNSTKYDKRSDALLWKVEWQFPGAGTIRVDPRVDESAPLEAVLQAHLRYKRGAAAKTFALRDYAEAGPAALRVLLRKEGSPANQPSYYAVDLGSCLRQQLAGAVVVENPVLIVALPGAEAEGYRVVPREPQQQGAGAGHGWAGHGQQQRQQQQYPGPPPRPAPQGGAQSRFATEAAGLQIAPPASSAPGPIQQEQQPSVTQEGQEQQQQQRTAAWAGHAQQQAAPVVGADLGATGVGAASEELATKRARMK